MRHIQQASKPSGGMSESYANSRCKKCKSSALDYGSDSYEKGADGRLRRKRADEDEERGHDCAHT